MLTWSSKDPDEVLDYEVDWSPKLEVGETLVTSTWTVPTGSVTINNSPAPSISGSTTKLWLSGGTDGEACEIQNRVVTSGGRTFDQTVRLRIRSH